MLTEVNLSVAYDGAVVRVVYYVVHFPEKYRKTLKFNLSHCVKARRCILALNFRTRKTIEMF